MNAPLPVQVLKQHLIDPEICIRCNTCEATCPVGAITHDSRNYVVDASKCNFCMDCISPCPTGSIDNWRTVPRVSVYGVDAQFGWDELPPKLPDEDLMQAELGAGSPAAGTSAAPDSASPLRGQPPQPSSAFGATGPPWSAARAYTNLYGPGAGEKAVSATVAGNVRVTEVGKEYDTPPEM